MNADMVVVVSALGVGGSNRSCGSKGGCCNTQKSLSSTLFPCQERQALAICPGKCQQCKPVRMARRQAKKCPRRLRGRAIAPVSSSYRLWKAGLALSPAPGSDRPFSVA
eukprot:scaffold12054_cov126-Isochrysis_galbana.AAC.1